MGLRAGLALTAALISAMGTSSPAAAGMFARNAPPGQCRIVHGRMALYNGTFSFRIRVIGTHRMLRVVDDHGDDLNEIGRLPEPLAGRLRAYSHDLFRPRVYADFTVCDFTTQEPGVMQSVTLTAAKSIRIDSGAP